MIPALKPKTARWRAWRRRLRARGQAGSAMVEFAFIAPIFFLLLMGILELGIMYFSQSMLQNATDTAARLIRTGQAQSVDFKNAPHCSNGALIGYADAQSWFHDQVCCGIDGAGMNCDKLNVDVETFSNGFPGISGAGIDPTRNIYQPGNACDVVMVRSFYSWPVATPLLFQLLGGTATFLANMADGSRLLVATAAFRNEPFSSDVEGC